MIECPIRSTGKTKAILSACSLLVCALLVMGCAAQQPGFATRNESSSEAARSDAPEMEEPAAIESDSLSDYDPESLDALMGKLATASTLEEARYLIGKRGDSYEIPASDYAPGPLKVVECHWLLGFGVFLNGYYEYFDQETPRATYTATYDHMRGIVEKTDLSPWDLPAWEEGERELNRGVGLQYDQLVELLGGVQGLKETVSTTGEVTYIWYDDSQSAYTTENDGYLLAEFGTDGLCKKVRGRHLSPILDEMFDA